MDKALSGIAAYVDNGLARGRLATFGLRMRVWWSRDRLTRELASGADSVESRELALRAGQLTAKQTREVTASSIDKVLEEADRRGALVSARVPLDRAKVKEARGDLIGLAERLRSEDPVRSQGMALVVLLLSDVERPLYGIGTADKLQQAITEASERLGTASIEDAG